MKELKRFLVLLLTLLTITGCELFPEFDKDLPPPPPPPVEEEKEPEEKEPILEITFPTDTIPYGDKDIEISWNSQNVSLLFVNNQKQLNPRFGTIKMSESLFSDTSFVFKAINKKKEVIKEVTIKVGNWTTSLLGLITYYPWKRSWHIITDSEGNVIESYPPSPETENDIFSFYKDGSYLFSNDPDWIGSWYLEDENSFVLDGIKIRFEVNEKELIFSWLYKFTDKNKQSFWRWSYTHFIHASDIPLG